MQKVTVQRTEYRQHVFEIPDGVEEGSGVWDDIINDFDWHNATLYNADESVVGIECEDPSDNDEFICEGCSYHFDIEDSIKFCDCLYCPECVKVAEVEVANRQMGDASP